MSTRMRVNIEDYLGLPVYVICVAVALGLLDSTIMGFDLSSSLLDLGSGHAFSVANIGAMLTLGYVAYTNHWKMDSLSGVQAWVVIATVGLLIAPPFFPVLESTLAATPAAFAALLIQVGGYVTFSYIG
jgi:hypothetical protein